MQHSNVRPYTIIDCAVPFKEEQKCSAYQTVVAPVSLHPLHIFDIHSQSDSTSTSVPTRTCHLLYGITSTLKVPVDYVRVRGHLPVRAVELSD